MEQEKSLGGAQECMWHIRDDPCWMGTAEPLHACLDRSVGLSCLGKCVLEQPGSLQMDQVLGKRTTGGSLRRLGPSLVVIWVADLCVHSISF